MNAAQRKLWDAAAPLIRANVLATLSIGQKWEVVNRTRAIAVARRSIAQEAIRLAQNGQIQLKETEQAAA